ncbi:uncharacterized protein LOC133746285 [Rosa rugosa]|uniref:uncharacterized protein LOC133746285 n=1 Tax=Rosa rugosa TaxID=74645 RepID=UPI002B4102D6|nr:uncharacterized protein LOC133746285 [Rosa rugosa]
MMPYAKVSTEVILAELEHESKAACRADVDLETQQAVDKDFLVDFSMEMPLYAGVPEGVAELLGLDNAEEEGAQVVVGSGEEEVPPVSVPEHQPFIEEQEVVPGAEVPVVDLDGLSVRDVAEVVAPDCVSEEGPHQNVPVSNSSGEAEVTSWPASIVGVVRAADLGLVVPQDCRVVASECVGPQAGSLAPLVCATHARSAVLVLSKRKGVRFGHPAVGLSLNPRPKKKTRRSGDEGRKSKSHSSGSRHSQAEVASNLTRALGEIGVGESYMPTMVADLRLIHRDGGRIHRGDLVADVEGAREGIMRVGILLLILCYCSRSYYDSLALVGRLCMGFMPP